MKLTEKQQQGFMVVCGLLSLKEKNKNERLELQRQVNENKRDEERIHLAIDTIMKNHDLTMDHFTLKA